MPMYDENGRLLVSSGFGDRITDLDGDTYVIAAEEYIDFFANGARYARIDVNGVQVTEYLAHYGDLDTYIRFRTNRVGIVVGNVDILDIIPGAVVWNEAGANVDFRWETLGGTHSLFIDGANGKVFFNDTANAFAFGASLTIDGKGQDGEYLTLQDSTDLTLGMTDLTDTDTFLEIEKFHATVGGAAIKGYGGTTVALSLFGYYTNDNVAKTSAARCPVEIMIQKKSGTGVDAMGADANAFGVRLENSAGLLRMVFLVDEDGDLFADGGIASTNMVTLYDDYEDAHLVRAFDLARDKKGVLKGHWDKFIRYNENTLVELGILGDRLENGGLTCITRLQQLHNGAIWQNYTGLQETKAIVEDHVQKLKVYERAFERISQALGIPQRELLALN